MQREFDLILQGATGFTGQLAAAELAKQAPADLRWAIAGRDASKLKTLSEKWQVPFVVASGLDETAVDQLASRTRVVISCAGPFARFGTPLVEACVKHQTHYADLTGELPWIHQLIQKHHKQSTADGTTLIPASGFDSVPTDLTVFHCVRHLQGEQPGDGENSTHSTVDVGALTGQYTLRGGFNGGTLASGLELYEKYPEVMQGFNWEVFEVPVLNRWAAPFLMAPVNEWVVRRSAALLDEAGVGYGKNFRYDEFMTAKTRGRAAMLARILKLVQYLMSKSWGRETLRLFGPKPGKGPSKKSRERGFAKLHIIHSGNREVGKLSMTGDPSNLITTRCLVQVGLALAAGEAQRGGVVTTAAAFGDTLISRLRLLGDQFVIK
ncbi:MAG: saccharopine dehydrogenase NADP-binding domain-containing protein [Planctomycetes bacterium]|nr:saccharopine dehydrogenase NADP-binding domain-containing protein [Planctomycetota bacterium]